ncbi:MAG: dihydroorotate dehydrogenase electron transfer subunit [Thermodesulfovibrionales bacterium]
MDRFFKAVITQNYKINPSTAIISLRQPDDSAMPEPGQFYMLQVSRGNDPLLKRPLSIFSVKDGLLHFLYRIVGKGTDSLSRFCQGDVLDLIGPLGNPYPLPNDDIIAIAGGTGIASLHGLLERCPNQAYLFYGTKNITEMIIRDVMQGLSKMAYFSTDDGGYGIKGNVIDTLNTFNPPSLTVYACGPRPMLSAVSQWTKQRGLKGYVSLEEYMACGVGACMSCVVKTQDGFKSVCKDGPVFDINEVLW